MMSKHLRRSRRQSKFLAVRGGKDMIGYGEKRDFREVTGEETVLG